MDKKKIAIISSIVVAVILLVVGVSYAYFSATVTEDNKTQTVIKANELSLTFNGTSEITADDMIPGDSFTKTFTVENTSSVKVSYNIYMEGITNEFNEDLVYVLSDETGTVVAKTPLPTTNAGKTYLLENIEIESGVTKSYTLKIEYTYLDTPQNDYQGAEFKATVGIDSNKVENVVTPEESSSIVVAYTYNEDSTAENYCVTGDEETCVKTTCYEDTTSGSCQSGTILDYKVNDNETVRFHVMYDNGNTLTMQSQKNTVYNVAWINAEDYAAANTDQTSCSYESCNDEGPITILNALESTTSGWSNVNTLTYTMGTTEFKTNAYTGCTAYNTCATNTYTMQERSAKARMITLQETVDLGCTSATDKGPIWMYNYLSKSTSDGGTINDTTTANGGTNNKGYWTMNASYPNVRFAWSVYYTGTTGNANYLYSTDYGARAVVEISK